MATRSAAALVRWRREAIRRIVTSREATLTFVARLPEREAFRPQTVDRWSVKDVLAHLLACDEETVRRLRLIARDRGDRIQWFESMAHADAFNARSVARARRLGLRTVLRRMERVRADLITRLERLPAEALAKCPTGIRGLDQITDGGLPRGRSTLVCGGPPVAELTADPSVSANDTRSLAKRAGARGHAMLGLTVLASPAMSAGLAPGGETVCRLGAGLRGFNCAVAGWSVRHESAEELVRCLRHLVHGTSEGQLVGLGWPREAAQLSDELQG